MSRSRFSPTERALRSRLAKLVHQEPMLRGTLTVRRITCGKPSCRCAKGERHLCLYLTCSRDGHVEQLFIPKHLEGQVRQWVESYHGVRDLLERLSDAAWEEVRTRKASKPRT